MRRQSDSALRQRRKRLLRQLPRLEAVLRGSLIERYKPCGKPGCHCAKGAGHGPKYYLSVSQSGSTPRMDYVPLGYHEDVQSYLDNYRQVQRILTEICNINRELLIRRGRL